MNQDIMTIHPDDVLTFKEIEDHMRRVAKIYDLPLRNITAYPMPQTGMSDRLGDCSGTGDIRLVLRCTVDGKWCDAPMNPDTVRTTAAHELAHLKHMNHGMEFQALFKELETAMFNQKESHRDKIIDKLLKLQQARQGEAALGNLEAAQSFAAMINKMLIEHELSPTDLDFARARDNDPVVEIAVSFTAHNIKLAKSRIAWQEELAQRIAGAHLCKILILPGSNRLVFVGVRSHATVAEYVYGTMVPAVEKMSKAAEVKYWQETGCGRGRDNKALGYRSAWIESFNTRIWERFEEARRAALKDYAASKGNSTETGLMRLNGALIKAQRYIDDKFSARGRAARHAHAIEHKYRNHPEGHAAGREAANNITLGRRGLNSPATRGQLKD